MQSKEFLLYKIKFTTETVTLLFNYLDKDQLSLTNPARHTAARRTLWYA